ncbi:MAG: PilN domain-containing protein [Halanaerobium sp.]
MSVIFKEKHYDRFLIFLKKISVFMLLLLLLLLLLNFNLKNKNAVYQSDLEMLQQEKEKFLSLIKEQDELQNPGQLKINKYSQLITLISYAENLTFNSLSYKNQKFIIEAESRDQDNIFKFMQSLKADHKFSEVDLRKLSQKNNYSFQLETILQQ